LIIFVIRRVLQAVVVLLPVMTITYALLRLIPGNVAVAVMGPTAYRNPLAIAQFDRVYGFNHPWYYQYWLWLDHLLHGDLGYSWKLNQSVASLLSNHLPKTVFLVGASIILALIFAIPIAVLQAVRRNKIRAPKYRPTLVDPAITCGLRGTGFLYVRKELLATLEPPMIDHFAVSWTSLDAYELRPDARRFETWENAYALRRGLGVAIDYALELGIDTIQARCDLLSARLRNRLASLFGTRIYALGCIHARS
jgi:hypothetical protein